MHSSPMGRMSGVGLDQASGIWRVELCRNRNSCAFKLHVALTCLWLNISLGLSQYFPSFVPLPVHGVMQSEHPPLPPSFVRQKLAWVLPDRVSHLHLPSLGCIAPVTAFSLEVGVAKLSPPPLETLHVWECSTKPG